MNQPTAETKPGRHRFALIGLFVLFIGPVGAAWLLYHYVPELHPAGKVNAGELIQPARPLEHGPLRSVDGGELPVAALRGRWTLVTMAKGACRGGCETRLHELRQLHAGLNKDIERVRRILLVVQPQGDGGLPALAQTFPDLMLAQGDGATLQPWLAQFAVGDDLAPARSGRVFLVDPLGNLMMFYSPDSPTQWILKDIRRLLKLSQIG